MRIAVGSTNPTKVAAAERAARRLWPEAEILPVAVVSGVSEQPLTDEETIRGAINRAQQARIALDADVGMGVEGGVQDTSVGMFVGGWAAVVDSHGTLGVGAGGRLLLPERLAAQIRQGAELGPLMDRFTGAQNVKHNQGAIGVFTDGLILRTDALEMAFLYALARFMTPELYECS
ncbi:MAG: inosine/xanthosine triphosphatase [Caldilineae bacterium]|nr:MAG: inosine/xanthosine triphosphatase [Caldilineae bacterium]